MLSKKPPMGFNTWNTFGNDISDEVIRTTADAMVNLGLKDAGYEYLVIDDCWSKRERDPETGKIVPDEIKFPNGMKSVSDYVHSKGLKFGMYSCAGTRTCADYPGSFDHEYLDAKTFAEYGADFLKYDFCYRPDFANGPLLYRKMSMALKASGREILFSACNWGSDEVEKWIRSTGAHMYRSTGDIFDAFRSMKEIALSQIEKINYSAFGCFNDMDMLTIGMYGNGNVAGKEENNNDIDYKTQFAVWCMFGCPLMLGGDIRKMNDFCLNLVKNKDFLRIDQDEECRPPFVVTRCGDSITFARVLSDNQLAILCVNFTDRDEWGRIYFENLGLTAASGVGLHMKDCYTGEDLGVVKEFWQTRIKPHDCRLFLCDLA